MAHGADVPGDRQARSRGYAGRDGEGEVVVDRADWVAEGRIVLIFNVFVVVVVFLIIIVVSEVCYGRGQGF